MLPEPRPERLVLISGGSGITPVLSMLRTLCDEGHDGEITFVHYARTDGRLAVPHETCEALARRHPSLKVEYVATREGGAPPRPRHRLRVLRPGCQPLRWPYAARRR